MSIQQLIVYLFLPMLVGGLFGRFVLAPINPPVWIGLLMAIAFGVFWGKVCSPFIESLIRVQ